MKTKRFAPLVVLLVLFASTLGCGVFGPVLSKQATYTPYPTYTPLPTPLSTNTPVPVLPTGSTSSLGNCSAADVHSQASQNYLNAVAGIIEPLVGGSTDTTQSTPDWSKMGSLSSGLPKVQAAYAALPSCVQAQVSQFNTDFTNFVNDYTNLANDMSSGNTDAVAADSTKLDNDMTKMGNEGDLLSELGSGTPQPVQP